MAAKRKVSESDQPARPPATTPAAREDQLVNLAFQVAERQLREGTASPTTVNHFLKLGSSREFLEQERLEQEVELSKAKRDIMQSEKRIEEKYENALSAMREYSGYDPDQGV